LTQSQVVENGLEGTRTPRYLAIASSSFHSRSGVASINRSTTSTGSQACRSLSASFGCFASSDGVSGISRSLSIFRRTGTGARR